MFFPKLLSRLNNKHFLSLAGNGAMSVFGVLTYSLLFRFLSPADMGNWIFFQFSLMLFETFRTGFLQTALIRFYVGASPERARSIVGSVWFIALVITGIFLAVNGLGVALVRAISSQDAGVMALVYYFGIAMVLSLPFNIAIWMLQCQLHFGKVLLIRVISQGSFILFILVSFITGQLHLHSIIYALLGSYCLTSLVSLVFGWAQLLSLRHKTPEITKQLFHFGKFSVGTVVSSNLLKSSDSFIIKIMLGPAALAIYNLPQRLMEIIEVPLRSLVSIAMPQMSAAFNQNNPEQVVFIMKKYAGLLTFLLLPVSLVMVLGADYIILLIGGGKYFGSEAGNLFRITMLFTILLPIDRFLGITLDIINKPKLNFIKVLLMLSVNVIGDVAGIYATGSIYAVALSSILTFLAGIIYGYLVLKQFLNFNLIQILRTGLSETQLLLKNLLVQSKLFLSKQ